MTENNILERLFCKFKTSEICPALEKWGYLKKADIGEVRMAGSKQNMVTEACDRCEEQEIDVEAVGELDILYAHLHSKQKSWSVYELTDKKEHQPECIDPTVLKRKLNRRLAHYFEANVSMRVLDRALWLRVCLSHGLTRRGGRMMAKSELFYIVHYPRTHFIASTLVKASFRESAMECLVAALGFQSLRDMNLKGRCLDSLAEIVLNRNSQGSFRRHRAEGDHGNPLLLHPPRKRKEQEEEVDERIVREDARKRQKTLDALDRAFGPYVQPTLEKIEFKVETQFHGFQRIHRRSAAQNLSKLDSFLPTLDKDYQESVDSKPFRCRVKFEGSNVLEGFRNLGKRGIASVPLPKHLTCVPSQARNYFVLADKAQSSRGLRSPAPA